MGAVAAAVHEGRSTLRAVSEAELLREVLIREVRALGTMYAVGKRRPITDLPPEKQQQIRDAYADTLWASDYCVEMMGICTSRALAEQTVRERGGNWFCVKLPIDSVLTEDTVQGEWAVRFPESDAAVMYENLSASTIAMSTTQLRMLEEEAERLLTIIKSARETTLKSP
jgi:hypothetical protein